EFELQKNVRLHACFLRHSRQPHQRRVADRFRDGIVDAATTGSVAGGHFGEIGHENSCCYIAKSAVGRPPQSTPALRARWQRSSMEMASSRVITSSCNDWISGVTMRAPRSERASGP